MDFKQASLTWVCSQNRALPPKKTQKTTKKDKQTTVGLFLICFELAQRGTFKTDRPTSCCVAFVNTSSVENCFSTFFQARSGVVFRAQVPCLSATNKRVPRGPLQSRPGGEWGYGKKQIDRFGAQRTFVNYCHMAMGQNPVITSVNIPITTKINLKIGGELIHPKLGSRLY